MKITSKTEAKKLAKAYSYIEDYKDVPMYIIYCHKTKSYYVDNNSLIGNWEEIVGYYTNGIFTANK